MSDTSPLSPGIPKRERAAVNSGRHMGAYVVPVVLSVFLEAFCALCCIQLALYICGLNVFYIKLGFLLVW